MDAVSYSREIAMTALGEASPCPRCRQDDHVGFNERMKNAAEIGGEQYRGYTVQCFRCGATSGEGNIAQALTDWNRQRGLAA